MAFNVYVYKFASRISMGWVSQVDDDADQDPINKALLSIGLERVMSEVMFALLSSRYAKHQLKVII